MVRHRLHRSSLVVASASLLVGLVIVLPGEVHSSGGTFYSSGNGGGYVSWIELAHGWPQHFLIRTNHDELAAKPEPLLGVPWLSAVAWAVWQAEDYQFSLSNLLIDLFVVLIGICVITSLWEWRRRKRSRLAQIRISELLVLTSLLAVALGWRVHQLRLHREEQQHVQVLEGTTTTDEDLQLVVARPEFYVSDACVAPTWLLRLVGEEFLPAYMWRASEIFYDPVDPGASDPFGQALPHLKSLRYASHFSCGDVTYYAVHPFSIVAELPQVRTLEIYAPLSSYKVDQGEANKLLELQQITKLVLKSPGNITPDAKRLLSERMPRCTIEYVHEE